MKNINQNISLSIHNLIAVLDDAKNGYLHASEKVKDSVLSLLMERFGFQRGMYSSELKKLVNSMGTASPVDQFTLSLLQRTWLDLKGTFRYGKKEQIIEGCIKAEETALKKYSHAIDQLEDNYELRIVLQQQANGIRTVLNTIKEYTGSMYNRI
jgi:uncharacterized protein (TIGR02284 family)